MANDLKFYVQRFQLPTGTGTNDFTLSAINGGTVVGAFFFYNHCTSDGSWLTTAQFGIGAASASGEQWYSVNQDIDNLSSSNCQSWTQAGYVMTVLNTSNSKVIEVSFSAFTTNGVTLNIVTNNNSQPYVTIVFLVSETIEAYAGIDAIPVTQDTSTDVTDPGFEPDAVFPFMAPWQQVDGSPDGQYHNSYGGGLNDGSDTQKSSAIRSNVSVSPTSLGTYFNTNYGGSQFNGTTKGLDLTSYDSSGFSVFLRNANVSANQYFCYLAFQLDGLQVYLSEVELPNTTDGAGNWSWNVGFQAGFACLIFSGAETANSSLYDTQAGIFGIGVTDGDREFCTAMRNRDNVTTTDSESVTDNTLVNLRTDDGTQMYVGSLVGFSDPNITVNFTTVQPSNRKKAILFAVEAVAESTLDGLLRRRMEEY